jgi:hypothetical protein
MQILFKVHRASNHERAVKAFLADGKTEVEGRQRYFDAELVPLDSDHGSMRLTFLGADIAGAKQLFTEGASISVSFDAPPAPAAAPVQG